MESFAIIIIKLSILDIYGSLGIASFSCIKANFWSYSKMQQYLYTQNLKNINSILYEDKSVLKKMFLKIEASIFG